MRVLAISSLKGGVGKTTVAMHVAAGLALRGQRTVFVDLDPYGAGTYGFGFRPDAEEDSVMAYVWKKPPRRTARLAVPERFSGLLAVLGRHISMRTADDWVERNTIQWEPPALTAKNLRTDLGDADWVVVDAPGGNGYWHHTALSMADAVLVPVPPTGPYAFIGLREETGEINRIQNHINPRLRFLGAVASMVDLRTVYGQTVTESLARVVPPERVFATVIPNRSLVQVTQAEGLTVMEARPNSPVAKAFMDLVAEVEERWPQRRLGDDR